MCEGRTRWSLWLVLPALMKIILLGDFPFETSFVWFHNNNINFHLVNIFLWAMWAIVLRGEEHFV